MADNTLLNVGVGGDTIATDDIGGIKYERVKVNFGADGSATDASSANPLPVDTELTVADLDTGAGTDTRAVVGLARAESGGAVLVGTANPLPVTANAGTGPFPVSDNAGSLTIDSTQLPAALAAGGGIKVEGVAGGVAQPISGTVTANAGSGPFPVSDNAGSLTVDAPVGTPAFVRLSDGAAAITALPVTDNAGSLTVDAPVGTPAFVRLSDGAAPITALPVTDNAGSLTVDGALSLTPTTSGGHTTFHLSSAATTNATNIKASAGQVYGWYIYNSNAAARKLVFHNTAGTPTAGASVFYSLVLPAQSAANVEFSNGIAFSTGIAITTVTGLTDADAVAVAAQDLDINIFYK